MFRQKVGIDSWFSSVLFAFLKSSSLVQNTPTTTPISLQSKTSRQHREVTMLYRPRISFDPHSTISISAHEFPSLRNCESYHIRIGKHTYFRCRNQMSHFEGLTSLIPKHYSTRSSNKNIPSSKTFGIFQRIWKASIMIHGSWWRGGFRIVASSVISNNYLLEFARGWLTQLLPVDIKITCLYWCISLNGIVTFFAFLLDSARKTEDYYW